MKKTRFLFSLLMAVAIIAFGPTRAWAQEPTQVATASELSSALSSSGVSVIQLTDDISTGESIHVSNTVTIDLNGHTITSTNGNYAIDVYYGRTLTLINGTLYCSGYYALDIPGTAILKNCTIIAEKKCVNFGSYGEHVLTIEDNTCLTSLTDVGIKMDNSCTLNINGVCSIFTSKNKIENLSNLPINIAEGLMMISSQGSQITNFSNYIGSYVPAVYVVKTETCAAGEHSLVHHEGAAATCTEAGKAEYWNCTTCGRYYADEQCTQSLSSGIATSPLGHNLVDDVCTRGDYSIPVFTEGVHTGIDVAPVSDGRGVATGYSLYKFIAPGKGTLTVAADGNGDSFGALFDASYTKLIDDDDSNGHSDFKFDYAINNGQTYYIGIRHFGGNLALTNYTITVTFEEADPYDGCEFVYVARLNHNEDETITWYDYYPVCNLHDEEVSTCAIISKDNGGTYTFNVGNGPYEEPVTVRLLCDLALPDGKEIIINGENIILDLNGKTISGNTTGQTIYLTEGSLTITDNSTTKTGKIVNVSHSGFGYALMADGGTLTIHGGTFESESTNALYVDGRWGATAIIDGGRFTSKNEETSGVNSSIPALAMNYSYYDASETELEAPENGPVTDANGVQVSDIIVKPAVKYVISITMETYDSDDELTDTQYFVTLDKALNAINGSGASNKTFVITLDKDQVVSGFTDLYYNDIILDLNHHTVDGTFEVSEGTEYHTLGVLGNLTVKNGTLKASISATGDSNVFTIDNATVVGSYISWQAVAGLDIKNGSTFEINNSEGSGMFSIESCELDATSKIVLTGVYSIGMYGNENGGYRNVMHRLTVPEGYEVKREKQLNQDSPDKKFRFCKVGEVDEDGNPVVADMTGVTMTILGSTPLTPCTLAYIKDDNPDSKDYVHLCATCYYEDVTGRIVYNNANEAFYTCEHFKLNETEGLPPVEIKNADLATYGREITVGWGTLCLPFELTVGASDPHSYYTFTAANADCITLSQIEDKVPAGHAVFVMPAEGEESVSLSATNVKVWKDIAETTGPSADGMTLKGTVKPTTATSGYYLDATDGFLYNIAIYCSESHNENIKVPAFRAWLDGSISTSASARLRITTGDEDATAIEAVSAMSEGNVEFYDLNGRRINSLQKGVNIMKYANGKSIKVNVK